MADEKSYTITLDALKPVVTEAANDFGVPEDSIWRKIRAENSGSPTGAQNLTAVHTNLTSPKGARGVMQVTPIALQDVIQAGLIPAGTDLNNLNPRDQIRVGAAYIKRLREYSTDPAVEDAMYNYGPKARFRMDQLPEETSQYLNKSGSSTSVQTGGGGTGTFGGGMLDSSQLIQMLLQSTGQQNQAMASGAADISAASVRSATLQAQAIEQQREVAANAASTAAQKATIDFTANKTLEQLQSLFNMDPTQVNNEISTSLAQAQTARDARISARAEYDQALQINPLENPLGYIMAQIKLPQLAAKNNSLADAEDIALQNVNWKTQALAQAKATVSANTADQLRDVQLQQAKNEQQLTQAKLTVEEAKNVTQAAQSRMQQIQIANQIGDNTRSTLVAVTGLQDREESFKLRTEQKEEILKGKKLKEEEDARLNERLKVVSDSLGMTEPMTTNRLKTLTNKKQQEAWLNAALTGQMGEDLHESLMFYLNGANKQQIVNSGGASTYDAAIKLERAGAGYQALAERSAQAQNPLGKKMSPAESRLAGFKLYQDQVTASMSSPTERADLGNSQWDKTYNPYVAQYVGFSKAIDTLPKYAGLKNNPIKQGVDDLLKSGVVKAENLTADQQQQLIGSVVERVVTHQAEPKKAAADIAAFYKAAAEYNYSLNKYDLFGLPKQTNYLYRINGNFTEFDDQKVDLTDPSSVENAMIKMARQRAVNVAHPFGFR